MFSLWVELVLVAVMAALGSFSLKVMVAFASIVLGGPPLIAMYKSTFCKAAPEGVGLGQGWGGGGVVGGALCGRVSRHVSRVDWQGGLIHCCCSCWLLAAAHPIVVQIDRSRMRAHAEEARCGRLDEAPGAVPDEELRVLSLVNNEQIEMLRLQRGSFRSLRGKDHAQVSHPGKTHPVAIEVGSLGPNAVDSGLSGRRGAIRHCLKRPRPVAAEHLVIGAPVGYVDVDVLQN